MYDTKTKTKPRNCTINLQRHRHNKGTQSFLRTHTFGRTLLPGGTLSFDAHGQADNSFTIVQTRLGPPCPSPTPAESADPDADGDADPTASARSGASADAGAAAKNAQGAAFSCPVSAVTLEPESERSGEFEAVVGWHSEREACGPEFVGNTQAECDSASQRQVTFFWMDAR